MEKVHVYTDGGKSVAVADKTLYFDFDLPDVFPKNFFYMLWWPEDGFCAYFTQENGTQIRFDLDPTEENYACYVKPFVDQWQAKNAEKEAEKAEQADEIAAAEVREKRDKLIAETDYLLMPDYPISDKNLESIKAYRQALRDLPQQEEFPLDVMWPKKPEV
jgi:hypothetical protein